MLKKKKGEKGKEKKSFSTFHYHGSFKNLEISETQNGEILLRPKGQGQSRKYLLLICNKILLKLKPKV